METNNKNNFFSGRLSDSLLDLRGENKADAQQIRKTVCNRKQTLDIGGDYIIPEYMPSIRKLIRVDIETTLPSELMTSGGIRLDGTLEYRALYTGADGKIYSVSFPAEYSFSLPLGTDCDISSVDTASVFAEVIPESVVSRVSGGGKINVRARLIANVRVSEKKTVETGGRVGEAHMQKLIKKADVCDEICGFNEDIKLAGELIPERKGSRFVTGCGGVFVEETACGEGYVSCRGNVVLKLLLSGGDEGDEIYTMTAKMPFSETVELVGVTSGSPCVAWGNCFDVKAEVRDAEEGREVMNLTSGLRLAASAFVPKSFEYVKDVYSLEYECECDKEIHSFPILLCGRNGNMTFSGSIPSSELFGESKGEIINVIGSAEAEEAISEGDKYTISGKCRFSVIYRSEEDGELFSADAELPFRYELRGENGEMVWHNCRAEVIDPRARIEGENVSFDCELALACSALGEVRSETVSGVSLGAALDKKRGGFTVCYPDGAESLWGLAKRYHTSVEKMEAENNIPFVSDSDDFRVSEKMGYVIV